MKKLFDPLVPALRQHPSFAALSTDPSAGSTRSLMQDVFDSMRDIDGNFVKEFQTAGFDARVWELYLHAYTTSVSFLRDYRYERPDLVLSRGQLSLSVECVTTNPTQGAGGAATPTDSIDYLAQPKDAEATMERLINVVPLRYSSSLQSKVNKGYHKLEHVAGRPLVALEPFHDYEALADSDTALSVFLYGRLWGLRATGSGAHAAVELPITEHGSRRRKIPTAFFEWPGTEHISAVLFSNSGTTGKFTRMAHQGPYPRERTLMYREGFALDQSPGALAPHYFSYEVGAPGFKEQWGQGAIVFHNPRAVVPLPLGAFPDVAERWVGADGVHSTTHPRFYPFISRTYTFNCEAEADLRVLRAKYMARLDECERRGHLTGRCS